MTAIAARAQPSDQAVGSVHGHSPWAVLAFASCRRCRPPSEMRQPAWRFPHIADAYSWWRSGTQAMGVATSWPGRPRSRIVGGFVMLTAHGLPVSQALSILAESGGAPPMGSPRSTGHADEREPRTPPVEARVPRARPGTPTMCFGAVPQTKKGAANKRTARTANHETAT